MKRLQSSSSAQTVASIDDLLLQILSRLRLKPLFRLKSVSKHWNSLISDLKHHPKPAVGLIVYPTNSDSYFAYEFPFDKSERATLLPDHTNKKKFDIDILHGCNGLLLYATSNTNRQFVINPTTMQRTMLPEPMHPSRILAMCLAFDPAKSPRYKVVCVTGRRSGSRYVHGRFQVYSSETGSWRYNTNMEGFRGFLDMRNGVYWNGALHWISISSVSKSIYFDPDGEDHQMPRVFPTPPTLMSHRKNCGYKYFGESCGHLHFVGQAKTEGLIVYEMKTDYSEWFVKYRLRHSMCGLIRGRLESGWSSGSDRISALFRGEKDDDCFLVLWDKSKITRYNIVSGEFEISHNFPHWFIRPPVPYFESICSV